MKIKEIFGINLEEKQKELEKKLAEEERQEKLNKLRKKRQTKTEATQSIQEKVMSNINLENYIKLPQHNLYVGKNKILHNLTWQNTWNELEKQGLQMLTIKQFMDFLELLRQGTQGKLIYNSKGNQISGQEIKAIYNEITKKRSLWGAEWLDAYFEQQQDGLYILTQNKKHKEKLENCIEKVCYVELKFNSQGLPTKKSSNQEYKQGKNIHYYYPRGGRVAGFYADYNRDFLDCSRDPKSSSSAPGVRGAKKI